jgi:4-amino-4-deoxy-L-arabinose transferase-like glycosyltransferase
VTRLGTRLNLLLVLLALTAWRWLATSWNGLELYADEAQYWSWALQPDWGYYSKPPVVAWLIHLGTRLFGDAEQGVRAATYLVWPLTSWCLYLLVARLYRDEAWGERAGFWAALLFASLPLTTLGGVLITTDGPLLLCWTLGLYFLARALLDGRPGDWLLLGACAGLGLLSKYSMLFFAPSLLAYLVLSKRDRRWLASPWPYAAALLALAILAPNLYWNAQHDYASLRHTADISQLDRAWLHWDALLEFFVAQFGVFGPLPMLALLIVAWHWRAWFNDDRGRFLALFCLVPLAAFLTLSLLSRAFANWAAFAYVAGSALVTVHWLSGARRAWLYAALALNLAGAAVLYHYHPLARLAGIELNARTDLYKRVTGNRELGHEVAAILRAHPDSVLLCDDRKTMAWLLYYARPASLAARYLNPMAPVIDDHYALSRDVATHPDLDYLLISEHAEEGDLRRRFREVVPLGRLTLPIYPDLSLRYRVWAVRGFLGYAR